MPSLWAVANRTPHLTTTCSTCLPSDVLLEICRHLDPYSDVLHLALVSTATYDSVSPALYHEVTLDSTGTIVRTLAMLARRPDIARHIRKLSIRPTPLTTHMRHSFSNSAFASSSVRDLAISRRLDALHTFAWLDDELPYHDDMWFSLRIGCPQLAYITAPLGYYLPGRASHLYDFSNLRGFRLHLKEGFFRFHGDHYLTDQEIGAHSLWAMLQRCQNLEELAFVGTSAVPADAHLITQQRWPRLRRLQLGDVCVDWLFSGVTPKRPFVAFLEAHPTLKSISLSHHNIQNHHLATLEPEALHLDVFAGTLLQLQTLSPALYAGITVLSFNEPLQTREVNGFTLSGVLQGLQKLQKLRVCFSLHCMFYDASSLLRSLINGAPQLQHLELACIQRPSFQLESFSKAVRAFPRLRTLGLIVVKYPGDIGLTDAAERLAKLNPRIKKFSLTYISPSTSTHHPPWDAMGAFDSSQLNSEPRFPSRAKSSGCFVVTTDSYGLPLRLNARVRAKHVWPWGLGEYSKTQRYTSDLRPSGTPGKQESGVLNLLFERSPAGEEIRMFAFCAVLVVLAVFGFWTGSLSRPSG